MTWRVMNSLLVLRDQVNAYAPNRSKGSDGTVCDTNHPTSSDHCPHSVSGVGSQMVTALDLTHDPAGGFDSYAFAETLRRNRDKRIKYVISNKRIFDTSGSDAWTWRPYTGSSDPHTGHVHISVLDDKVSDTSTEWNLEGFMAITETDANLVADKVWYRNVNADDDGSRPAWSSLDEARDAAMDVQARMSTLEANVAAILALLQGGGGANPTPPNAPVPYTFTGTATPQVP